MSLQRAGSSSSAFGASLELEHNARGSDGDMPRVFPLQAPPSPHSVNKVHMSSMCSNSIGCCDSFSNNSSQHSHLMMLEGILLAVKEILPEVSHERTPPPAYHTTVLQDAEGNPIRSGAWPQAAPSASSWQPAWASRQYADPGTPQAAHFQAGADSQGSGDMAELPLTEPRSPHSSAPGDFRLCD